MTQLNFKAGQVWKTRDGHLATIVKVNPDATRVFCIDARLDGVLEVGMFRLDGRYEPDNLHVFDLVELVSEPTAGAFQSVPVEPDAAIIQAMVDAGVSRVAVLYHWRAILGVAPRKPEEATTLVVPKEWYDLIETVVRQADEQRALIRAAGGFVVPNPLVEQARALLDPQPAAPLRDREADRARWPYPEFNNWLDEPVTENGERTVWDLLVDIDSAQVAWNAGRSNLVAAIGRLG